LVDEVHTIKYLFLENVANILNNGMELIVTQLHKKRNFTLIWVVVEAREVGAPHLRRRWFCVAHRQALAVALKATYLKHQHSLHMDIAPSLPGGLQSPQEQSVLKVLK
jgi:site-specific DNA-cytosine methylase